MSKSFSEREREIIRLSLIDACKECWSRYGYQKTGIRELAGIAGISPAAFYHFFDSKEVLFVEAAHGFEAESERLFGEAMRNSPDKRGIAEGIKAVAKYIGETPWIAMLHADWAAISRRLPEDYLEKDFLRDRARVERIIADCGLKPKRGTEFVTQVVDMLFMMVMERHFVPGDSGAAFDFIIDSAVENLFE